MAKKEHRVQVRIRTIHVENTDLNQLVKDFQEILKEYPDAWIDCDYDYEGDRVYEIFGTRKETELEEQTRIAEEKKAREAAKKEKQVKQARELKLLAELKVKYEKE